jgi:hypothetical protein
MFLRALPGGGRDGPEQTLRDVEEHVEAPSSTFRESRPPTRFSSYLALMSNISESEPSTFEEAADEQVWRDAMVEEYSSIMRNDVWDIVPRLEGKSMWSLLDGSIRSNMKQMAVSRSTKRGSWREGSPRRREWTMRRHLHLSPDMHLLGQLCLLLQRWGGGYIRWM